MTTVITQRRRVLLETNAARDKAEALLQNLMDAKRITERELSRFSREDPKRSVTGRSAIDDAIASTRRMIETLNRSLHEAERELAEEEAAGAPQAAGRSA